MCQPLDTLVNYIYVSILFYLFIYFSRKVIGLEWVHSTLPCTKEKKTQKLETKKSMSLHSVNLVFSCEIISLQTAENLVPIDTSSHLYESILMASLLVHKQAELISSQNSILGYDKKKFPRLNTYTAQNTFSPSHFYMHDPSWSQIELQVNWQFN